MLSKKNKKSLTYEENNPKSKPKKGGTKVRQAGVLSERKQVDIWDVTCWVTSEKNAADFKPKATYNFHFSRCLFFLVLL